MGVPDAGAQAALDALVRRPVSFVFLDLLGAPLRVTNAPVSMMLTGTGDADLDGFAFQALDARFCSIGPIVRRDAGGETVTLQLSGLAGLDDEMMTELGAKANYQGRDARIWRCMLHPEGLGRTGNVWSYFSGVMNAPKITGDAGGQLINLELEDYTVFFGQASGRTYLSQAAYDPGDRSAELAIAIANGVLAGGSPASSVRSSAADGGDGNFPAF